MLIFFFFLYMKLVDVPNSEFNNDESYLLTYLTFELYLFQWNFVQYCKKISGLIHLLLVFRNWLAIPDQSIGTKAIHVHY